MLFQTNTRGSDWSQFRAEGFPKPVTGVIHCTDNPASCGMPLGGIGTGCIDIETWSVLDCILALTAVGQSALAAEPATIRLWDYHIHDKKFRQSIFKEFNKANPDVKVECTSQISTTYETVLNAAFRVGTPPDLFVPAGAANLPKLLDLGWVKAGGGYSVFPEYNKPEDFPHPAMAKIARMGLTGNRVTAGSFISSDAMRIWQYYAPEGPNNYDILQGIWIGKLGWDALADLDRRYNGAMDNAIAEARKAGINVSRADFTYPDWDPAEPYPPPKKK